MPDENDSPTTAEEEERLRQAARDSTLQTLEVMGFDTENPRENQAKMQTLDAIHRARQRGAAAFTWALITLVMGGLATAIVQYFKPGGSG